MISQFFSLGGGILGPSDLDLGKKVGSLDLGGGGDILGPSDLNLGKKVGSLDFLWGGGFLGPSDLDSLTIFILGGYSGTLRFGLRKESWKFGFFGGGVFWDPRIWTL